MDTERRPPVGVLRYLLGSVLPGQDRPRVGYPDTGASISAGLAWARCVASTVHIGLGQGRPHLRDGGAAAGPTTRRVGLGHERALPLSGASGIAMVIRTAPMPDKARREGPAAVARRSLLPA